MVQRPSVYSVYSVVLIFCKTFKTVWRGKSAADDAATQRRLFGIISLLSGIDAPGWGYKTEVVRTGPAAKEIRRNPHGAG